MAESISFPQLAANTVLKYGEKLSNFITEWKANNIDPADENQPTATRFYNAFRSLDIKKIAIELLKSPIACTLSCILAYAIVITLLKYTLIALCATIVGASAYGWYTSYYQPQTQAAA